MTWDGVDNDEEDSIARREAYEWMETSIPEGTKYILIFIRKGDAIKESTKHCGEDLLA